MEFINNKDLLNEKEKEKLEELEKEIYKKDLFIRNKNRKRIELLK